MGQSNWMVSTVTDVEAQLFAREYETSQQSIECCTVDNFRIQLSGTPAASWNKSAGQTFTESFIAAYNCPDDYDTRRTVFKAFQTRLKSLIKDYRNNQKTQDDIKRLKSDHKRYERKSNVGTHFFIYTLPITHLGFAAFSPTPVCH